MKINALDDAEMCISIDAKRALMMANKKNSLHLVVFVGLLWKSLLLQDFLEVFFKDVFCL